MGLVGAKLSYLLILIPDEGKFDGVWKLIQRAMILYLAKCVVNRNLKILFKNLAQRYDFRF